MLRSGLEDMGLPTEITINRLDTHRFTILLGAHLLHPDTMASLKEGCAIFNLEQLSAHHDNEKFIPYLHMLSRLPVIDYCRQNLSFVKDSLNNSCCLFLPLFFTPALADIPPVTEDIDVLFFGSMNERRKAIIDSLKKQQINVVSLFGVYGKERDAYIARSKLVLNLHYYQPGIFEEVRVAHLLANGKAVVAEINADTFIEDDLRNAVAGASYGTLVDTCVHFLRHDDERRALAVRGQQILQKRDPRKTLEEIRRWSAAISRGRLPLHINLGSGKDWKDDCLNLDISESWQPDIIADISDPLLFEKRYPSKRWGEVALERNSFQSITANDVLEHVPDLTTAMRNCLDLLEEGGTFHIQVPYDLSYGAWQDPTHLRAFNEKSWLYYTSWSWYLGWTDYCFEPVSQGFVLSELGNALKRQGQTPEQLARTPRAVDSIRIILRKKALTMEEKAVAQSTNTQWLMDLNR